MTKKNRKSLADPTQLKPMDEDDDDGVVQVIIETPKGSRNKFSFDAKQRIFSLKKVLPAGMVFPHDFGFLPQTLAPDGHPIDVLLLMDEPAFPGIAEANPMYANIRKLSDLPDRFVHELEDFFVNYHNLEGKQYKLLGCKGVAVALRLIKQAQKAA